MEPGFIQQHPLMRRTPERADLLGLAPGGKDLQLDPQLDEPLEAFGFGVAEASLPLCHRAPGDAKPLGQSCLRQADGGAQCQHQLTEGIVALTVRVSVHERSPFSMTQRSAAFSHLLQRVFWVKRVFSIYAYQYISDTVESVEYIFLIIAFTCMGPLNISFSPAQYIFLEITFVLFTAILQGRSKKCRRTALGRLRSLHECLEDCVARATGSEPPGPPAHLSRPQRPGAPRLPRDRRGRA